MTLTFDVGIPSLNRMIITPYGPASVRRFREDGRVDIYVGAGRTLTVAGSTPWREARIYAAGP